eukprot:s2643_g10.t1
MIESETCIGFRDITKIKTIHRLALILHHGFASRLGARHTQCHSHWPQAPNRLQLETTNDSGTAIHPPHLGTYGAGMVHV